MLKMILSAGASAFLIFGHSAMAEPMTQVAQGAISAGIYKAGKLLADEPPAETEMPTAGSEQREESDGDRLPDGKPIEPFGDSIDSGEQGG